MIYVSFNMKFNLQFDPIKNLGIWLKRLRKKWKWRVSNSYYIAFFRWVIIMTRMHNFVRFLFSLRKYVIIMIHWKFHNRWLILNYEKWTDKVSLLLTGLATHVNESSTMKFSVDHDYDVFSQEKQKSNKIMHVSHNYDSSKNSM